MRNSIYIGLLLAIFIIFPFSDSQAQRKRHKIHYAQNAKKRHIIKTHKKPGRYAALPKWGARVNKLHVKSKLIKYKKHHYYFHSGIYYRKINNKYRIVRAPIGIRVNILPATATKLFVKWKPYYYYYGTFYIQLEDKTYETINPPVGAKVEDLPEGLEEVEIKGETLYKLEEIYFKPIINKEGKLLYEVVNIE